MTKMQLKRIIQEVLTEVDLNKTNYERRLDDFNKYKKLNPKDAKLIDSEIKWFKNEVKKLNKFETALQTLVKEKTPNTNIFILNIDYTIDSGLVVLLMVEGKSRKGVARAVKDTFNKNFNVIKIDTFGNKGFQAYIKSNNDLSNIKFD